MHFRVFIRSLSHPFTHFVHFIHFIHFLHFIHFIHFFRLGVRQSVNRVLPVLLRNTWYVLDVLALLVFPLAFMLHVCSRVRMYYLVFVVLNCYQHAENEKASRVPIDALLLLLLFFVAGLLVRLNVEREGRGLLIDS